MTLQPSKRAPGLARGIVRDLRRSTLRFGRTLELDARVEVLDEILDLRFSCLQLSIIIELRQALLFAFFQDICL
jgi:hypothetical protein